MDASMSARELPMLHNDLLEVVCSGSVLPRTHWQVACRAMADVVKEFLDCYGKRSVDPLHWERAFRKKAEADCVQLKEDLANMQAALRSATAK
mmetsp:Transcript_61467/g.127425  ORF Transcript_61467/g.127425 Transcript_61467/m.127425 type:complete len:93 (+) Transcript_61467:38-316(+)